MKHIAISVLLSMLVALSACGGDPEKITITAGDFAEDFSLAACERAASCGFQADSEIGACVDFLVNELCDLVDCSTEITADYSDYHDCLNAYDDFSCALLDAGEVPSECRTIMEF